MKELEDLVKGWRALPAGTPVILATVVGTSGSTYRKAGAKMLLTQTGWIAGSVSGGCLESDLLQSAWQKTEDGPVVLTYDATGDEDILWGFGLGCNGVVRVFLERACGPDGVLGFLADRFDRRARGLVTTVLEPGPRFGEHEYFDSLPEDLHSAHTGVVDGIETFFDPIVPPLELIGFGAGFDAVPLVGLAKALGWHVAVVDRRAPGVWTERFSLADSTVASPAGSARDCVRISAGAAVVLMTHNFLQDRELLRFALESPALYVGVMGPKLRSDRLLQDLRDDGFVPSPSQIAKLHAPIGLDLGADAPDEIALSIIAEIQAFIRHRRATPLRDSTEPLHPPTSPTSPCGRSA